MIKLARLSLLFAAMALMVVGCQNEPAPVGPQNQVPIGAVSAISVPSGAVFQSAKFYIFQGNWPGNTVNLHRVTSPWTELGVTWNSFDNDFDPAVVGSFVTGVAGWADVDVTSLVQDWLDGTHPNYGIYLEQGMTGLTEYWSSDYGTVDLRPKLELCYTVGSMPYCIIVQRGTLGDVYDAYIWENIPDNNFGTANVLTTGLRTTWDIDKQSLVWFELPETEELASLGDTVWYDDDQDGIQDAGEAGFAGVTVNLYTCAGLYLNTTTTDANGYYIFTGLAPGDYRVEFIAPEGYTFSPQNQGSDDAVDSDADPTTGMATECASLSAGEHDPTWDAGLYMITFEGCTLTIGFWKNHAGLGPGNQPDLVTQYLPIMLGDGTGKTVHVTTAAQAVDILSQHWGDCDPSNGIAKLYAQLLGAKLNIANGASNSSVKNTISKADAWLAMYDCTDWGSLSDSKQNKVLAWKDKLDGYNNGDVGPGHCD